MSEALKSGISALMGWRPAQAGEAAARRIAARFARGNVSTQYERFLTEKDLTELAKAADAELTKLEKELPAD